MTQEVKKQSKRRKSLDVKKGMLEYIQKYFKLPFFSSVGSPSCLNCGSIEKLNFSESSGPGRH